MSKVDRSSACNSCIATLNKDAFDNIDVFMVCTYVNGLPFMTKFLATNTYFIAYM